jgi:AI-2 transport protein TqsA
MKADQHRTLTPTSNNVSPAEVGMSSPNLTEPRPHPSFLHRLLVVTLSVFLVVLLFHLARELQAILQPLFIAFFLAYLILPAHALLVRQGIPPRLAIVVFLFVMVVAFSLLGRLIYSNVEEATARLPHYERRMQHIMEGIMDRLPWERDELAVFFNDLPLASDTLLATARATLGRFFDFLTWMAVTLVYFVFLVAEKVTFPKRMLQAFGPDHGGRLLTIIQSINVAIAEYISVKTSMSVLAGVFSTVVLGLFGVDFYIMWGILIFLLNYIPYLGSLVAVALPILLAFVQLDEAWKGVVIAILLIAIQQLIGTVLEPRMAGQRLGVSPLLILLSLAFWGLVWGVVGMILAVPILVTTKIILDNIPETKPLAILMSNVE